MENDFLPVGSVVLLKDAKRPVVIIGFSVIEKGERKVWDYLGCAYPVGVVGTDKNLLFQRNQIEKIISKGYEDEECKKFLKMMQEQYEEIKKEYGMM